MVFFVSHGQKQYFAPTDIHVLATKLEQRLHRPHVRAHDEAGIGGFASGDLFGPQYNIRIGQFINKNWAIELSFDHTKYTSTSNQIANVSGTVNGVPVNGNQVLTDNYFRWLLHNGTNHLMVNAVYRAPLYGELNESLSLAFIGKAGVGIMVPHVDNTIMGNRNDIRARKNVQQCYRYSQWLVAIRRRDDGDRSRPSFCRVEAGLPRTDRQVGLCQHVEFTGLPRHREPFALDEAK